MNLVKAAVLLQLALLTKKNLVNHDVHSVSSISSFIFLATQYRLITRKSFDSNAMILQETMILLYRLFMENIYEESFWEGNLSKSISLLIY